MVQHADFFDQAQRDIQRDEINQGTDADAGCGLRQRRQENTGRRRRAQGRAVVLRQVVAPETRGFRCLGYSDPLRVGPAQRLGAHIQVVENTEFYRHIFIVPRVLITKPGHCTLNLPRLNRICDTSDTG